MMDEPAPAAALPLSSELAEFPSETDDSAQPPAQSQAIPAGNGPVAMPIAAATANDGESDRRDERGAPPSVGPARVTEFPVQLTRPPTPAVPEIVPAAVTLMELLERQGGLDWRHAVGVIHQICRQLRDQPPNAPIMLEARNILITQQGEVHLLPGQIGGDPLVIQLGRLLRTMLMGNDAPPELRLLLAQATFELPIFESIEDVDRALRQLEKVEVAVDGKGFARPVVAPPASPPIDERPPERPASQRSILPLPEAHGRNPRRGRGHHVGLFYRYSSPIALLLVILAAVGGVIVTLPKLRGQNPNPGSTHASGAIVAPGVPPYAAADTPVEPVQPAHASEPGRGASQRDKRPDVVIPTPGSRDTARGPSTARDNRVARAERSAAPDNAASGPTPAPTTGNTVSPRESERRALALMAQGQTTEAAMAFDSLVLSNPLYEPKASDLSPESFAAFRASQKQLLPVIAQRNVERGRTALSSGDSDRALTLGREAAAILERPGTDAPSMLRQQVQDLLADATAARLAADEIVYSATDAGVLPPRQLSRQFPATSPIGVPPHRVGTLEMIVGKSGDVEFVKLHTPLNRYHERMIVSAAKAWRYRPATRNGQTVRYRITVKINLPESGTDF